jgi:hypothetical protein
VLQWFQSSMRVALDCLERHDFPQTGRYGWGDAWREWEGERRLAWHLVGSSDDECRYSIYLLSTGAVLYTFFRPR